MAVTVTTGKTHVRYARLLVQGHNLSGDSRSLGAVGFTDNLADVTGWTDIKENIKGIKSVNFGQYEALFNNKASAPSINAGTHTVLSSDPSNFYGSVVFGIGEHPTIGSPSFSATLEQFSYMVNVSTADAVTIQSTFFPGETAVAGWGTALAVGESQSATIDLPSFDNGAALANGAMFIYHVSQSVGAMGANDWDLTIEDSPADAVWGTVGSVAGIGSTITAGIITTVSSVDRYTRVSLTKNAGTDLILWVMQIAL